MGQNTLAYFAPLFTQKQFYSIAAHQWLTMQGLGFEKEVERERERERETERDREREREIERKRWRERERERGMNDTN
jgi:hypothetical protein